MANFLSQPILTGYLNGIALLIMVGQVPKLFGYPASEELFLPRILEFFQRVEQSHWPTAALGATILVVLVLILLFLPRLPGAFVVVGLSILLVLGLDLEQQGVAVLGNVPAGLPSIVLPSFNFDVFNDIFGAAAGIVLVSFTSGVLTAKSFARRNGYEVNANQELIGFGACNLASGLAQGFPVTGADSRTAVNNAMGGKTQMVGLVAGGAMLLVLVYLTAPLALVPSTALAAVILVFQTLKPAIKAFLKQQQKQAGHTPIDTNLTDQALDDQQWREPVELPRMKKPDVVPAPAPGDEATQPAKGLKE